VKLFKGCKKINYLMVFRIEAARRCSYAARVLGRIDDRWTRYVNGTESKPGFLFPIEVPRDVPFDGIVSNERSRYPGLTNPDWDLPVVDSANHQNIYKRRDGLGRIAQAMILIGMTQAPTGLPDPPDLAVAISGPAAVRPGATCTWSATATNGTAPYSYAWSPGGDTSAGAFGYTNGGAPFTVSVTVTDAAGTQASASLPIDVAPCDI